MTTSLRNAPLRALLLLCCLLLYGATFAQRSRSNNKSSNPYRGQYQRIATGNTANYSFEIRNGALWAWGPNFFGQLGDGTTTDRTTPTQIGTDTKWVSIAGGSYHTLALKSDGTLWAWGNNAYGQLGDGTTTDKTTPTQIGTGSGWVSIATGYAHTLALKSDGTLWAWGNNSNGQLGDGTTTSKNTPTQIGTGSGWVSVATGHVHTLGLKSDGTLWAWGYNYEGQLGDSTNTQKTTPTQIGTGSGWVSIAGGAYHTLALKSDGTLWAWGYNAYGQLGDGSILAKHTPTQISTDTKWTSIAAGFFHNLALKSDGTLWAWGYNAYGQLGDGTSTITNTVTPTQVGTDTKWTSTTAGYYHSLGLKSDGTLWAWGYNSNGQLGDDTTTNKMTPTQVIAQLNVIRTVSSSQSFYSAIIRADRSNICMAGYNGYGELGDGTTTNSSSFNCANSICTALIPATVSATYSNRNLSGPGNRTDFQLNCALAASITPSGTSPVAGTATGKVFIDASVQSYNSTPYVQRHHDIEPATNPGTATGTVTLYYTQAEFTAFNAARGSLPALPVNAADAANNKANLRITQYHGVPTGGNNPTNYPTGAANHVLITPASVAWDVDNNWWAATFPVTGFSGFFASTNSNAPLPVKLLSFAAQKTIGVANRISWATATEDAGTIFDITRSGNGSSFEQIGTAAGKGSNSNYYFDDAQPLNSVNYYRLKITEAGGEVSYSNVAIVRSGSNGGAVTITPVPAHSSITITSTDAAQNGGSCMISDMQGREVLRFAMAAMNTIDISGLANGIYGLHLPSGEIMRIVKQ